MSSETETRLLKSFAPIEAWVRASGDYPTSGAHVSLFLQAEHLPAAAALLLEREYFIEDIAGVDVEEGFMVVYHFDRFDRSERVVLRVIVPRDKPVVPSIVPIFTGAEWHERECCDFYGVQFAGNPNLKPLLLPDDLGLNPLIKEQGRQSVYSLLPLRLMVSG